MTHLRRSDLEAVLSFLLEAGQHVTNHPYPIELLLGLQRLIPCDAITYADECPADGSADDLVEIGAREEPIQYAVYLEAGPCPTKAYRHQTGDLRATRTSDVLSVRSFRELPVYREYFRPNGIERILDLGLAARQGNDRSLVLFRDSGARDFTERDRDVLELLRPHLVRFEALATLHDGVIARAREPGYSADPYSTLTNRERDVVALLADGRTNAEIAAALWIAPSTVKKHLENVYAKTGIGRRTAIAVGMQRSLM